MTLPARMTAIAIRTPGGPEMLVPEERPTPTPGTGEVLVKVAAAGVNRPDVMQRMGLYPPPKGASDIPGFSGGNPEMSVRDVAAARILSISPVGASSKAAEDFRPGGPDRLPPSVEWSPS